jgi:tight adherence protein B
MMTIFLISFMAFVAVMLIMQLFYVVWGRFFDRRNKAKKKHLQAIQNTVQPAGQILGNARDSALEAWLRSRFRTFEQLEALVQSAHSPLTALRLMGLMLTLFTVVVVLGLLRHTNPLLLPVLAIAIAGTPLLWLSREANQRHLAFEGKLPEAIDYISRALRAGHSLTSAIGMVGKEFPDPIGHEFKTVFDEIGFGIPFKDAISQLADRVQSNDLNFFVISLMIQHETGGNLTELLDGLTKTMRERFKLRGKIRTLSSEGRASTWILGSMPFVLAVILALINPGYISVLWTTPQGQTLILIGAGLIAVGFFLLNRITQIKV